MEQLTLEQAANNYAPITYSINGADFAPLEREQNAFKAGAGWQKEQYQSVISMIQDIRSCLLNAPNRQHERDLLEMVLKIIKD